MTDLRIVFMGTPDFAVASLEAVLDAGYNVVGVVTAPDKQAGRGRKLQSSAVKKFALERGLDVYQPVNLKSDDFIDTLKAIKVNLQIIVAFRMLPEVVWSLPKFGTFNLHASLLPAYRGAAPIHWAIINGELNTGVTTFFIDEKIDTGEIILQRETSIGAHETVGMLHDKLMDLGSKLVVDTVKQIENGSVKTFPQPEFEAKKAPKLFKDTCKINWEQPVIQVYNFIRGLNPFPCAWTILSDHNKDLVVKIFDVELQDGKPNQIPGIVLLENREIKVACLDGFIVVKSLQLEGKKKMDYKSLLNGYSFSDDAIMR